jgi:hypothetical protein
MRETEGYWRIETNSKSDSLADGRWMLGPGILSSSEYGASGERLKLGVLSGFLRSDEADTELKKLK